MLQQSAVRKEADRLEHVQARLLQVCSSHVTRMLGSMGRLSSLRARACPQVLSNRVEPSQHDFEEPTLDEVCFTSVRPTIWDASALTALSVVRAGPRVRGVSRDRSDRRPAVHLDRTGGDGRAGSRWVGDGDRGGRISVLLQIWRGDCPPFMTAHPSCPPLCDDHECSCPTSEWGQQNKPVANAQVTSATNEHPADEEFRELYRCLKWGVRPDPNPP